MRAALRLALTLAAIAVATTPLYLLGVGGFRGGLPLVAGVLIAVAVGVSALAFRGAVGRSTWMVVGAVVALVVAARVVEVAPPSAAVLAGTIDDLALPFFTETNEVRAGNGRCDPCPSVVRTYRGPTVSADSAEHTARAAILSLGQVRNTTITYKASLDFGKTPAVSDDRLTLVITARARRG